LKDDENFSGLAPACHALASLLHTPSHIAKKGRASNVLPIVGFAMKRPSARLEFRAEVWQKGGGFGSC
jgi:hypothetical protein